MAKVTKTPAMPLLHTLFLLVLLLFPEPAYCAASDNACTQDTCKAGTTAITYATKNEPYHSCPTRELADYSNTIVGLVVMQAMIGVSPNISDKTGEPEFKGETKDLVDRLRVAAQVSSFDEAIASCRSGRAGRKVIVMNVPEDTILAVYVHDTKSNINYWMPIGSLNRTR